MRNLRFIAGVFFVFILFSVAFSQVEEKITITTYYPSPYGSYQGLEARRLSIGTADTANPVPDVANPTTDGVVNFRGQASNPTWADDGALYYNSADQEFRYYNGTDWVPIGSCTRLDFTISSGITPCPYGTSITMAPVSLGPTGFVLCCPSD